MSIKAAVQLITHAVHMSVYKTFPNIPASSGQRKSEFFFAHKRLDLRPMMQQHQTDHITNQQNLTL